MKIHKLIIVINGGEHDVAFDLLLKLNEVFKGSDSVVGIDTFHANNIHYSVIKHTDVLSICTLMESLVVLNLINNSGVAWGNEDIRFILSIPSYKHFTSYNVNKRGGSIPYRVVTSHSFTENDIVGLFSYLLGEDKTADLYLDSLNTDGKVMSETLSEQRETYTRVKGLIGELHLRSLTGRDITDLISLILD